MKRSFSRLLAFFMCLAMLVSFLPAGAAGAEGLPAEAAEAESGTGAAEPVPAGEEPAETAEPETDGAQTAPLETGEAQTETPETDGTQTETEGNTAPAEAGADETEAPAEDEPLPVEVEFVCTPEELSLTVWEKAAKESETAETPAVPIEPEENGHYLLLPGVYVYTAACEGYVTAEDVEFEVKKNVESISIEIILQSVEIQCDISAEKNYSESVITENNSLLLYANAAAYSQAPWLWPVETSKTIGSNFGLRDLDNNGSLEDFHSGIDISCAMGSAIRAAKSGTIFGYCNSYGSDQSFESGGMASYGNYVAIHHDDGTYSLYAHMSNYSMITSGYVNQGDIIGYSGQSGTAYGPHLHFQARENWSGTWSAASGLINVMPTESCISNNGIYVVNSAYQIPSEYSTARTEYIFSPGKCTLTFDANGGSCSTKSLEVQSGETLGSRYPTPTRSGYRFLGWFFSKTVSDGVDANTPITRSMTLYAHWSGTQNPGIKISFDANGGTLPGATATRAVDAVNTGRGEGQLCVFDFPGEVVETNCWGAEVAVNRNGTPGAKRGWSDENKLTVPTGGFVLSGHKNDTTGDGCTFVERIWNSAYIGFNYATNAVSAYGDLNAYLAENKYVETSYVYGDLPTPSRDGYIFDGWYTSATGGTEVTYDTYVSVTSPQTLYAHWHRNCEHDYRIEEIPGSCVQIPGLLYICQKCSDIFFLMEESAVSEWSTEMPSGVNDGATMSRVEYRYRTKETTSGSSDTMPGWTLDGSENVWGEYGAWSGWTRDAVTASESTQVETCALYRYYFYLCDRCGDHNPLYGSCGCGGSSTQWYDIWSPVAYKDSGSSVVSYANAKRQTTSLGDGQLWYFSGGNLNSTEIGTKDTDSDSTVIEQGCRYRTRAQSTVYHFYRWSDWSEWSSVAVEATDSTDVEIRTLYRYYLDADSQHQWDGGAVTTAASCDTEGIKTYTCAVCGKTKTETVAPLGHDWGPWVLTSAPTETSDGVETRSCRADSCGKTETRPVAASFVTVRFDANGGSASIASQNVLKSGTLSVLPTASRDGYSFDGWYTAASGGEKISTSIVFDSDTTVYAHWTKSVPAGRVPGDATDDGEVNIFDLLRLKKYLAGVGNASVNMANADVTGDGEVNIFDLLRLKKHLAGMDVTLV